MINKIEHSDASRSNDEIVIQKPNQADAKIKTFMSKNFTIEE
jgi:hypothetical protein